MTTNQDFGLVDGSAKSIRAAVASNHPLSQAAMRLSDAREGRSRFKAKELVGLLLCHGARAWRASQPVVGIRLSVRSPNGPSAVRLNVSCG